ncbi:MAG: hypothetical protein IPN42_02495 [Methylococcaceae bacterium]|nr:hypothetical protein [Methylococcaceae bacterium]
MALMRETFDWLKPSLLRENGKVSAQADFQPQLLKFETDEFMETFLTALAAPDPKTIHSLVLNEPKDNKRLKLFQPGHGHFYLVCAALCCRIPGFPDRKIIAENDERVFFVLRKQVNGAEYAWCGDETQRTWQALNGNSRVVLPKEERLPLTQTSGSDGRALLFGYIPAASRETYAVSPEKLISKSEPTDIRIEELQAQFTKPLLDRKMPTENPAVFLTILEAAEIADDLDVAKTVSPSGASRVLTLSVSLLIELWEFFDKKSPDVALALKDNPGAVFEGEQAQEKSALMSFLHQQTLLSGKRLDEALRTAALQYEGLNRPNADLIQLGFDNNYSLLGATISGSELERIVKAALDSRLPDFQIPKFENAEGINYFVRCVYERPHCDLNSIVVSQPSLSFQLAPYFDPDAPVRPVRITLPADVSIAGLRRFKKGVTFLLSSSMQKKVSMITGKEKTLLTENPELGGEGEGLAFICSFSIQIIFIVAFFLLLIFVIILHFVFWWIAFFRICLPIPKKLLPG